MAAKRLHLVPLTGEDTVNGRVCDKCGVCYDSSGFDGIRKTCRICRSEIASECGKRYYSENKEAISIAAKEAYRQNPEKFNEKTKRSYRKKAENCPEYFLLVGARIRAKNLGLPFDITLSDCVIPEYCPYLHIKLQKSKGTPNHASPSLDRINPALGYVSGNVMVISYRANALKSNASVSEISLILDAMKRYGAP